MSILPYPSSHLRKVDQGPRGWSNPLYASDVLSYDLYCLVQLLLTPASNEDIGSLLHEKLGRGQSHSRCGSGNHGDFAFDLISCHFPLLTDDACSYPSWSS